jgi:hypothetical protein
LIPSVMVCAMATDGSAALYAAADDSDVPITSSKGVPVMSPTKSIRKCVVHLLVFLFGAHLLPLARMLVHGHLLAFRLGALISIGERTVHRIPNDFSIADSARAAIVWA